MFEKEIPVEMPHITRLPLSALNLKELSESEIASSRFLPHRPTLASSIPAFPVALLVRVHKGLREYSLKMAHCGDKQAMTSHWPQCPGGHPVFP